MTIKMTIIMILQVYNVVMGAVAYIPQIRKIAKRKSVEDISLVYWLSGTSCTLSSITVLLLAENPILVFISPLVSIMFSLIIIGQIIYYKK